MRGSDSKSIIEGAKKTIEYAVDDLVDRILALEDELSERDETIVSLENQIVDKEDALAASDAEIVALKGEIAELEARLDGSTTEIGSGHGA